MKYVFLNLFLVGLLFLFIPIHFFQGGDYTNHFEKSSEGCGGLTTEGWSETACEEYTPLYHNLVRPFTSSHELFRVANVILFVIITPFILYWITRNPLSIMFYFTLSSYVFFIMDGIFPQGLAMLLGLGIFATRDRIAQVGFVMLMNFSHGIGLELGILLFIVRNLPYDKIGNWIICSGVFGEKTPNILKEQIPNTNGGYYWNMANLVHPFIKIFPLPFVLLSVYQYFVSKKWDWLVIGIITFTLPLFISPRVFYLMPLFLIPGLTWFYEKTSHQNKQFILLACILMCFIQWYTFINFKLCTFEVI